jgi:hypothetical protein
MQQIRKAVVADSALSTYAHNIKIIPLPRPELPPAV